ncbi:DNA-3-methyladenine glycosylase [Occallatibacter savannae]|uniref:DNA-3-methyladenine glycosylase n=1 Tax=Occallatibacter savannae TaxID=1002691 RepID=UPI000D68981D|nr:DNA-3-methyladenine glycosylase [Occallatibacter savannae]
MEQEAEVSGRRRSELPGRLVSRRFFEQSPETVAPQLLGKLLVSVEAGRILAGRIVEVEAYLGPHSDPPDPAAHSHRGPTPRNMVLFGPAGYAYVYSIYGLYYCMNISCEREGLAGCVLLRALEPVVGVAEMARNRGLDESAPVRMIASGPSRLCLALGLTRPGHNGLDVASAGSSLQVREDDFAAPEVVVTPRIGIKHAVDLPLRFAVRGHPCVSGPKKLERWASNPST